MDIIVTAITTAMCTAILTAATWTAAGMATMSIAKYTCPGRGIGDVCTGTLTGLISITLHRPLLMLWTAPPPARECQGRGCC